MKKEQIQLTDDPLTNINLMIPLLDDKGRESMSHLMYGYYLGKNEGQETRKERENVRG